VRIRSGWFDRVYVATHGRRTPGATAVVASTTPRGLL
jgi:hypothetical protein